MARNNRGGGSRANGSAGSSSSSSRSGSSNRTTRSNRSAGSGNDWSGGVMDMARERPIAAAAVAAGAAAAGLFLWSKRSQISNQISSLSDQLGEWTENMGSSGGMFSSSDDTGGMTTSGEPIESTTTRNLSRGMSETGGGNASLGRASSGGGTKSTASGRGRAQSAAPTPQ